MAKNIPVINKELMCAYYKNCFPHKLIFRWLSYGRYESCIFEKREFSFIVGDNIYLRFRSYEEQEDFQKYICEKVPTTILIGAVMNERPRLRNIIYPVVTAKQRELIFDIDINDYDDVRTCCSLKTICQKCWKFIVVAVHIIEAVLRDDFGFQHILWVFSGRRGIHGYVCDALARHLETKDREAISEYMQILKCDLLTNGMHHSIKRALKIIQPRFEEIILEDQNLFATGKGRSKLVNSLPEGDNRNNLEKILRNHEGATSKTIWNAYLEYMRSIEERESFYMEEMQLYLMHPRLDNQVTREITHLLKSPFTIHADTGKCCLPLSTKLVDNFDPVASPTIWNIIAEQQELKVNKNCKAKDSMKEYQCFLDSIEVFRQFVRSIEIDLKEANIVKFANLDF